MRQKHQIVTTSSRSIPQTFYDNDIMWKIAGCDSLSALKLVIEEISKEAIKKFGQENKNRAYNLWCYVEENAEEVGEDIASVLITAFEWTQEDIQTLLNLAIQNNSRQAAEYALKRGAQPTDEALYNAYRMSDSITLLLIDKGASIDQRTMEGNDFLLQTIQDKKSTLSKYLLDVRNDVNPNTVNTHSRKSALMLAVEKEQVETVSVLLNNPKIQIRDVDKNGNTALHYAASTGNQTIISMLIGKGASIKAQNLNHQTPLDLAKDSELVNTMQKMHQENKPYVKMLREELNARKSEINNLNATVSALEINLKTLQENLKPFLQLDPMELKRFSNMIQREKQNFPNTQKSFMKALFNGDLEQVKALEANGASFGESDKGFYPLVAAIYGGHLEMVNLVESKLTEAEKEIQWKKVATKKTDIKKSFETVLKGKIKIEDLDTLWKKVEANVAKYTSPETTTAASYAPVLTSSTSSSVATVTTTNTNRGPTNS